VHPWSARNPWSALRHWSAAASSWLADGQRPDVPSVISAALLAGEGLLLVGLALYTGIGGLVNLLMGRGGDPGALLALVGLLLLAAVGLVTVAVGLLRGRRWALAPLLLSQALAVLLAWNLLGDPRPGWRVAGGVLGIVGVVTALTGMRGRRQ